MPKNSWGLAAHSPFQAQGTDRAASLNPETLLLEQTYWLQQALNDDLGFDVVFAGRASAPSQESLYHPNGINVYCLGNIGSGLALLMNTLAVEGVNVILLPPSVDNLFLGKDGEIYCHSGIFLNRAGQLQYGRFRNPLPLHAGYQSQPYSKKLEVRSFPLLDHSAIFELTNNKLKTKVLLQQNLLPTPPFAPVFLSGSEGFTGTHARLVQNFIRQHQAKGFVLKPIDRMRGDGVQLFHEEESPAPFIQKMSKIIDTLILEKRIKPFQVLTQGQVHLDFNFRVVLTKGENGQFIPAATTVRAAPVSKHPVNYAKGARTYLWDSFFETFELTATLKECLLEKISLRALNVLNALQERFVQDRPCVAAFIQKLEKFFHQLNPFDISNQHRMSEQFSENLKQSLIQLSIKAAQVIEEKTGQEIGLLGIDLMLDTHFQPYILEINSGLVGGLGDVTQRTPLENKHQALRPVLETLKRLATNYRQQKKLQPKETNSILTDENPLLFLASLYGAKGDLDQAAFYCLKSIQAHSNDAEAYFKLSQIYIQRGEWSKVLLMLNKALSLDPLNLEYLSGKAGYLIYRENWAEAQQVLIEGLVLYPNSKELLHQLAQTKIHSAQLKQARETLQKILTLFPDDAEALYLMAQTYLNETESRAGMARLYLMRLLQYHPNHVPALVDLGVMHLGYGQFHSAKQLLEDAILADPEDVWALFYLAKLYQKIEHYSDALNSLDTLLTLEPQHPEALALKNEILEAESTTAPVMPLFLKVNAYRGRMQSAL